MNEIIGAAASVAAQATIEPGPQTPLVSVIVRTHGARGGLLRECLASVVAQDYRPLEIVVVEDGGSAAKGVVDDFTQTSELTIRHRGIPQSGRCVAGNVGLEMARGEWLNFLDDDDQFFPDHVRLLVERVRCRPDLQGAFARALVVATDIHSLDPLAYTERSRAPFPARPFPRWFLWLNNQFPIQACLFHRSLFEAQGGFDPRLDILEDWNLWTRYFSNANIELVDAVTSFFRIPADRKQEARRLKAHAQALPDALRKQQQILVTVSAAELLQIKRSGPRELLSPAVAALCDWCERGAWQVWPLKVGLSSVKGAARLGKRILPGARRAGDSENVAQWLAQLSDSDPEKTFTLSVADAVAIIDRMWATESSDALNLLLLQNLLYGCGLHRTRFVRSIAGRLSRRSGGTQTKIDSCRDPGVAAGQTIPGGGAGQHPSRLAD